MTGIPDEIWEDIVKFKKCLTEKGPTAIAAHLVQMYVDSPRGGCDCGMDAVNKSPNSQRGVNFRRWAHEHHAELNRAHWNLIAQHDSKLFAKLRRVLQKDLKTLEETEEEAKAWHVENLGPDEDFVFRPSGKITGAYHSYSRDLLEHFLWANPQKADWI